jgi:hypothetical protein
MKSRKIVAVVAMLTAAAALIYEASSSPKSNTKTLPRESLKERQHNVAQVISPISTPVANASVFINTAPAPILPPRWKERTAGEWQGMLVDLNATPYCEESSLCGLARSCKNNTCTFCERDSECASGEFCVMDHCLLSSLVECRKKSDCGERGACILSGYSSGPRGNQDMKSYCIDLAGGIASKPSSVEVPAKDTRKSLPDDHLLERARQASKSSSLNGTDHLCLQSQLTIRAEDRSRKGLESRGRLLSPGSNVAPSRKLALGSAGVRGARRMRGRDRQR